jgi:hypothetical protein
VIYELAVDQIKAYESKGEPENNSTFSPQKVELSGLDHRTAVETVSSSAEKRSGRNENLNFCDSLTPESEKVESERPIGPSKSGNEANYIDSKAETRCNYCTLIAKSRAGLVKHMRIHNKDPGIPVQLPATDGRIEENPDLKDSKGSVTEASEPVEAIEDGPIPGGSLTIPDPEPVVDLKGDDEEDAEINEKKEPAASSSVSRRPIGIGTAGRRSCLRCPFKSVSHRGYIQHMRAVHPELSDLPPFPLAAVTAAILEPCPVCGVELPYGTAKARQAFKEHVEIHQGLRPFLCPFCERGFKDVIRLLTHSSTHNGENYFGCSNCGEQFKHKTAMLVHSRACRL